LAALSVTLCGCAGLPPGSGYPKTASLRLAHPEQTRIGSQVADAARAHEGLSGFRIITPGV